MISEELLLKLVKNASKAPSGHNTQPWKFKIISPCIYIYPDFTKQLPIVDADNHALYISLGCALENLIISAQYYGFEANYELLINNKNETIIKTHIYETHKTYNSELFYYIKKRQVTRNLYKKQIILPKVLNELSLETKAEGIQVNYFVKQEEISNMLPFIIEGSNSQFHNKAFVSELVSWFRFSEREILKKGDGLWTASMGLPNMPKPIGRFIMKYLVSAKSEAKRWNKVIQQTPALALFSVERNEVKYWIELGRVFQRFALKTTQLGLHHAHVNMPCEEVLVREKLIREYNLNPYTPLLLIRFGFSNAMPYSYRRKLVDLLI